MSREAQLPRWRRARISALPKLVLKPCRFFSLQPPERSNLLIGQEPVQLDYDTAALNVELIAQADFLLIVQIAVRPRTRECRPSPQQTAANNRQCALSLVSCQRQLFGHHIGPGSDLGLQRCLINARRRLCRGDSAPGRREQGEQKSLHQLSLRSRRRRLNQGKPGNCRSAGD
jgi:hypothetical protein